MQFINEIQFLNSFVKNCVFYIKPSLKFDQFGEEFLFNGTLDLNKEGAAIRIPAFCYSKYNSEYD